jgi:NADPH-dependent 2,4-dienoyl-CoA reductase/sulfur reductase-like enzyme/rhodanese-related sulfurtransferase
MRLVIVGGVAGGATAAARARRLSEEWEIILFERGYYVSFANCGLPYYIGGEIEKRDDLFIASPDRLRRRYRIDVRTFQEVTHIDRSKKEIHVRDCATDREFTQSYDKLILSPGACPTKPALPGIHAKNIFTLRDLPDTDSIKTLLDRKEAESVVVVGAGAIGMEAVENFRRLGLAVSVIEKTAQAMPSLDWEMATYIHRHLRDQNVDLYLNEQVESFSREKDRLVVNTGNGMHLPADMVLLAMGVRPEKTLAEKAGLAIGDRGGILVDDMLQTSDTDIYAIGDVIEVRDLVSDQNRLLALAGPANKQGRIAADNIMGRESRFEGVLGTNITRVFKLVAASTGDKEEWCRQLGIPVQISYTHSYHHASYYPGARPMAIKLIFHRDDGKILGAQIVGEEGVDKRIDVIATAIRAGMSVYDLEELELAYAPQFGAAKDPVNVAGFVASNILKGDVEVIYWHELDSLDEQRNVLLDVRTLKEIKETGIIKDALHIHVDELRDRLDELDKDKTYIAYCTVSLRGYIAYRILVQNGFKAKILSGGMETWTPIIGEFRN